LERSEKFLEEKNKEMFLLFMRGMLQWRPEDRKTAKELLDDPWLMFCAMRRRKSIYCRSSVALGRRELCSWDQSPGRIVLLGLISWENCSPGRTVLLGPISWDYDLI
jgi:hypothetical protein